MGCGGQYDQQEFGRLTLDVSEFWFGCYICFVDVSVEIGWFVNFGGVGGS